MNTKEEEGSPGYANCTYLIPVVSRLDGPHVNTPKPSTSQRVKERGTECIKSGEDGGEYNITSRILLQAKVARYVISHNMILHNSLTELCGKRSR